MLMGHTEQLGNVCAGSDADCVNEDWELSQQSGSWTDQIQKRR